jgi:hypothetical protein
MPAAVRRLGAAVTLLAAVVFSLFGVRAWWSHGESVDQAVWAQVTQQTVWLDAALQQESKGLTPPCGGISKRASLTGTMRSGDSAAGKLWIRDAGNRLMREGWFSYRGETDIGDGLGSRQRDTFKRQISGRAVTITFVGVEKTDRPLGADRPAPDPPRMSITMEPKFCGF